MTLGQDTTRLPVVGLLLRPGVLTWITRLEYEQFPPDTPANEEFTLHLGAFGGLQVAVASVPRWARRPASLLADACGWSVRELPPRIWTV